MENNNNDNSSFSNFLGMLTILFIGLKLTGFISWSWFWVLSPIILPIIVVFIIFLIMLLISIKK